MSEILERSLTKHLWEEVKAGSTIRPRLFPAGSSSVSASPQSGLEPDVLLLDEPTSV